jgi:ankyrin repeat protein
MTPLMYTAAHSSRPEIIQMLLKAGAQLETRSRAGSTPLMFAASFSKSPEIVQALLDKGADPLARCKDGKKAIDYAKKNKNLVGTKAYLNLRNKSLE